MGLQTFWIQFQTSGVLGIMSASKMQWADHIAHCIKKSSKALTAIGLINNYFTTHELLQLVTSNFYSVLYYNSEIWHLQSLKTNLKQRLLSASSKAIKTCVSSTVLMTYHLSESMKCLKEPSLKICYYTDMHCCFTSL